MQEIKMNHPLWPLTAVEFIWKDTCQMHAAVYHEWTHQPTPGQQDEQFHVAEVHTF